MQCHEETVPWYHAGTVYCEKKAEWTAKLHGLFRAYCAQHKRNAEARARRAGMSVRWKRIKSQ